MKNSELFRDEGKIHKIRHRDLRQNGSLYLLEYPHT